MPKIPQYNRQRFQSSYVGAPQVDRSGEVLAAGVTKGVGAIVDVEAKKAHAVQQNVIDQQADSALMDFGVMFQKRVGELKDEYANDPTKLADAVMEAGSAMAGDTGKEIPDERIRSRYLGGTTNVIKQAATSAVTYGQEKQKENAVIAATEVVRKASLMAGDTKDPEVFFNNVEATEMKLAQMPGLDAEEVRKLMPEMLDSHLYKAVNADPDKAEADIKGGMYNSSPYFDSDMKEKFLNKIKAQRRFDEAEERRVQDDTYRNAIDEISDRELPYSEHLSRLNRLKPEMRLKDYTSAKKVLFNRIGKDTAKLLTSEPKSVKYINAVYAHVSSDVGRAEMSALVLDLSEDGFDKTELQQLNKMYSELKGPAKGNTAAQFLAKNREYLSLLSGGNPMPMANAIREYLTEVREGKNPAKAGEETIKRVTRDKVIAQDPSLAHVDDPVEEAYTRQATSILDSKGKKASAANVQYVVNQLKQAEKK